MAAVGSKSRNHKLRTKQAPKQALVPVRDVTAQFVAARTRKLQEIELLRLGVQKRFIKLVNLLGNAFLWHKNNKSSYFWLLAGYDSGTYSARAVHAAEIDIVGAENWQDDLDAARCGLCFSQFTILNRKHHCRLCGCVVDENQNLDRSCSAQIPAALLIQKLPQLNYAPEIKGSWATLVEAHTAEQRLARVFSFRCCKTCKNLLLHDPKLRLQLSDDPTKLFTTYQEFLNLKAMVSNLFVRYSEQLESVSLDNTKMLMLRSKLVEYIKELEKKGGFFKAMLTSVGESGLELEVPPLLVSNMYKTSMMFLLDSIQKLKDMNEVQEALSKSPSPVDSVDARAQSPLEVQSPPKLSKREIRERREQLMVINEQKFLVEDLIEKTRKQRKFDEVHTLEESKKDLEAKIAELEEELGDFGF
ncbi:hypothetical protein PUMCH_004625 [Australozyma saopauloensis]|uniref:FYVE-type domain-containing protein n=1 Tax=Australozyma saopauloensis TaxID=291208 RepID=A0AAX4HF55_9ASCO|nr:hypothetical protein PUMCH_004625 [[Candida] saopauloensis]